MNRKFFEKSKARMKILIESNHPDVFIQNEARQLLSTYEGGEDEDGAQEAINSWQAYLNEIALRKLMGHFKFFWLRLCGWPKACAFEIAAHGDDKKDHRKRGCRNEEHFLDEDFRSGMAALKKDGEL